MKLEELPYFDPREGIVLGANRLPHWQQSGRVYFVTFRLADALPRVLLERWVAERETWLQAHPFARSDEQEGEYRARFTGLFERWLDAGYGSCPLRKRACAGVVAEALSEFEGERYDLLTWVVMPNHVHVLMRLRAGENLPAVVRTWKLYSARRTNTWLGRRGQFWQRDYFDRLVRDRAHLERCVRYVRRNPIRAGLSRGEFLAYENPEVGRIE